MVVCQWCRLVAAPLQLALASKCRASHEIAGKVYSLLAGMVSAEPLLSAVSLHSLSIRVYARAPAKPGEVASCHDGTTFIRKLKDVWLQENRMTESAPPMHQKMAAPLCLTMQPSLTQHQALQESRSTSLTIMSEQPMIQQNVPSLSTLGVALPRATPC